MLSASRYLLFLPLLELLFFSGNLQSMITQLKWNFIYRSFFHNCLYILVNPALDMIIGEREPSV